MAISDVAYKILWGRAAGRCSNPGCREDLTVILDRPGAYHIGEMAHIIAKSPSGPRGQDAGGPDAYENLILLCPTCHKRIDKAPPGEFTEGRLRGWKKGHEDGVRNQGKNERFDSLAQLKAAVSRLLIENRTIWLTLGPKSEVATSDPGSNLYVIWNLRVGDTIVPNNQRIINLIEANVELLPLQEFEVFLAFKNHATAFEEHWADRLDAYPTFPRVFEEVFRP